MIDERDASILALLEANGRISNSEIARQLGLSESYIRQRLKRLIASKRISRGIVVDFSILGMSSVWCLRLKFEPAHVAYAIAQLTKEQSTGLVMPVMGEFDIYAIVAKPNPREFSRFLDDIVKPLPGYLDARTSLIVDAVKYDANRLPLRLLK